MRLDSRRYSRTAKAARPTATWTTGVHASACAPWTTRGTRAHPVHHLGHHSCYRDVFDLGRPAVQARSVSGRRRRPVNLVFTNSHPAPITVTSVTVTVTDTSAGGCGAANFSVSQQLQATPTVRPGQPRRFRPSGSPVRVASAPDARRREPGRLPERLGESRLRGNGDGMTAALVPSARRRRRLRGRGGRPRGRRPRERLLAYFSGAASGQRRRSSRHVGGSGHTADERQQPAGPGGHDFLGGHGPGERPAGGRLSGHPLRREPAVCASDHALRLGGVVTTLSCTETAVPFGSWQYTITPVIGANWRGTESTKSGTVTIGAAA